MSQDAEIKFRLDLPNFLNKLGLTNIGVEVGVQCGNFAKFILENWKGRYLYLVDIWRHLDEYIDVANVDHNGHLNNLAHTFMNTYKFGDRAIILKDSSVHASTLFQNESLDFVLIDANHSYEAVRADLECWSKKIKKGGLFYGHDYANQQYNGTTVLTEMGVKRAVDEWSKENKISINTCFPEVQFSPDYAPFWWYIV